MLCSIAEEHHGQPMQQLMGDLPKERVEGKLNLLSHTLVWTILVRSTSNSAEVQRSAMAVCSRALVTRAVHIEIAHSLDSDGFIMALHRFRRSTR